MAPSASRVSAQGNRPGLFPHLADRRRLGANPLSMRDLVREQEGHERQPTAAVLDRQSVKTIDRGGPERGYDAGKRIHGRKRHLLVDTLGLSLLVKGV